MSLPDLAAVLWRQRELIERLSYRLECEQLLLAAGRTARLALATTEVETALQDLNVLEIQRAEIADRAAGELGLPAGSSLEDLAAAAQPPWTGVLLEHRQALLTLTAELSAFAEVNKHLLAAGAQAVEAALSSLGVVSDAGAANGAGGYDARGRSRTGARAPGQAFVDRVL